MKPRITITRNVILLFLLLVFSWSLGAQVLLLPNKCVPTDMTEDGSTIVGVFQPNQYFMWDEEEGLLILLGDTGTINSSIAPPAISADGSLISGLHYNPLSDAYEMSIYDTHSNTWTCLGSLGNSSHNGIASVALDISGDGSTVVGYAYDDPSADMILRPVKWTPTGGLETLNTSGMPYIGEASRVNYNGNIIGGYQRDWLEMQGCVWTNGVQTLISYPNGNESRVYSISDNGNWVGGGNSTAWKWSQHTGLIEVGPTGATYWSHVNSMNQDGTLSIGYFNHSMGPGSFIHRESIGFTWLTTYLYDLGIDLQSINISVDNSEQKINISSDGSTVSGMTSENKGFIVRLNGNQINNTVNGAIAIECGENYFGNTQNATDTGRNNAPDVYFAYTGTGVAEYVTLSLCNEETNYDSYMWVFDDENLNNVIASNDNACGLKSEVTFESDGTSTYYIMIEGAGTAAGSYSMEVNCEEVLTVEANVAEELAFYPNPVREQLHINAPVSVTRVEITGIGGQSLRKLTPEATEFSIDFSALPAGMYFVTLEMNNRLHSIKIVKQYR